MTAAATTIAIFLEATKDLEPPPRKVLPSGGHNELNTAAVVYKIRIRIQKPWIRIRIGSAPELDWLVSGPLSISP